MFSKSDCVIKFPRGQSEFSGSSSRRLLNYLERGNENSLCYGLNGQPLTGSDKAALIDYADSSEFKRMGILSLRWGNELSDKEYRRSAREFFWDLAHDRPSLRVAYSIHRNTEHHHIQFAVFGDKEDCWLNKRDLGRYRHLGRVLFSKERDYVEEFARELDFGLRRLRSKLRGVKKELGRHFPRHSLFCRGLDSMFVANNVEYSRSNQLSSKCRKAYGYVLRNNENYSDASQMIYKLWDRKILNDFETRDLREALRRHFSRGYGWGYGYG